MNSLQAFSPTEWQAILLSAKVATAAVLGSLPFAVSVARLLAGKPFPGRALVDALVHLPLVLPPVLTGYLLLLGFGRQGPIGSWLEAVFGIVFAFRWTGAALAAAVMAFPLMVRSIRLSMQAVDPHLLDAAASLGAGRWRRFMRITLPLSAPGIAVGVALGFAKAMGEFGATITFVSNIPGETQTLSLAIHTLTQIPGSEAAIGRLAVVALALSFGALLISEVLARRAGRDRQTSI